MSIQRAIKNCENCLDEWSVKGGYYRSKVVFQDKAMQALEHELMMNVLVHEDHNFDGICENLNKALSACQNCDYKTAKIVEMYKKT